MLHGGAVWDLGCPDAFLDFSANLRPDGPPPWVIEAIRKAVRVVCYYPDITMREERGRLAAWLHVPDECALPTAGGLAAIDAAVRMSRGRIITLEPTFGEYAARAITHGKVVLRGTLDDVRQGDLLFLCNPNNPTGQARSRDEVLNIAERVRQAGALLAVDEAFIDFCQNVSVRDIAAADDSVIVVGSLTKTLCIPGVRLGYIVSSPSNAIRLSQLLEPWSVSAFASGILKALPSHADEISGDAAINAIRRSMFISALEALGIAVMPSCTNYILCQFPQSTRLLQAALRRESILVRDCASFGLTDTYLRLAVKTERQNELLAALIEKLFKQTIIYQSEFV